MDLLTFDITRWLLAAWFIILGGVVGSFLNVVVYRLPAGMSIAWPPSHCPRCQHAIRAFDNIPVLAWLWLRGRCRDCRQWISLRYPLVEAATAGLFLLLLVAEVFQGGHNLPVRVPPAPPESPSAYPLTQALSICLLHAVLLCTLIAAALIHWDGKQPPERLFLPLVVVGLAAASLWPWLRPLPAWPKAAETSWGGLINGVPGFVAALVLGRGARWLGERFAVMYKPGCQVLGEALVIGVVLGWQAVVLLAPLALLLEQLAGIAAVRWRPLRRLVAAVWIAPLTLLWILNWAWLVSRLGIT